MLKKGKLELSIICCSKPFCLFIVQITLSYFSSILDAVGVVIGCSLRIGRSHQLLGCHWELQLQLKGLFRLLPPTEAGALGELVSLAAACEQILLGSS